MYLNHNVQLQKIPILLKFMFSKKATKIDKMKILSIFVAFIENTSFT